MARALMIRLLTTLAVISLIVVSAVSVHGMAPDRNTAALEATMLAFGATSEDLCLDGSPGHAHDCPLCHKLPDTPQATAPDGYVPLVLSAELDSARALDIGPIKRTSGVLARAPPYLL